MNITAALSSTSPSIWSFSTAAQIGSLVAAHTVAQTAPVSTPGDLGADPRDDSSTVSLASAEVATLSRIYGPNDLAQVEASPVARRLAEQINGHTVVQTGGKPVLQPTPSDRVTLTGDTADVGDPRSSPSRSTVYTLGSTRTPGSTTALVTYPAERRPSPAAERAIGALLQTGSSSLRHTLYAAA